jgi:predicted deacylase
VLLAGLEGWEYSATAALLRVVRELEPAQVAGSVAAWPQAAGSSPPEADAVLELRTAPPWQVAAPHARGDGLAASLGVPWLDAQGTTAVVAGSGGRLEPAAVRALAGAARAALRALGAVAGDAPPPARRVDPVRVDAAAAGWWVAAVRAAEEVHEGSLLGRIRDPWGDVIADIRSPADGIVLRLTTRPPVAAGDELVVLGR